MKYKDKTWDELSIKQKISLLNFAISCSRVAFWKFTSKETQKYYKNMIFDAKNNDKMDEIRLTIYNDYIARDKVDAQHIKIIKKRLKMED